MSDIALIISINYASCCDRYSYPACFSSSHGRLVMFRGRTRQFFRCGFLVARPEYHLPASGTRVTCGTTVGGVSSTDVRSALGMALHQWFHCAHSHRYAFVSLGFCQVQLCVNILCKHGSGHSAGSSLVDGHRSGPERQGIII